MMTLPIYLIVAVAQNGVIGRDGDMPWRLSTDLKRFKALTMERPIIMGRKTWNSLGRPLPGRMNIVVTRQDNFTADGAISVHTLSEGIKKAQQNAVEKGLDSIFIIGGGEIFKEAMPLADKMYVTEIQGSIDGDTYFPKIDPLQWRAVHSEDVAAGEKDSHATRFVIYERNR